ncbi:MAG: zinc dependent phospholipase C family protein [Syntrophaceae bacterium]|nr:zinc dependent phospholipase C family protein [Syntrophaceae bacterium]
MPKEITHWLIASAVSSGLEGTAFREPLDRYGNILKIGAVVHDAPYYYLGRDRDRRFGDLPRKLHGTVADACGLIGALLSYTLERPSGERSPLLAFLVGLVTHLFADALFHPMIFYLTGPYHHLSSREGSIARQDHRRLEALIDISLAGGYERVRDFSLASFLGAAEVPPRAVFAHAGTAWLEPGRAEGFAGGLASAFRLFAFMQGLFRNPFLGRLSFSLFPAAPASAREILALVYAPRLSQFEQRIRGVLQYRHPCTGREEARSIDALFREAVEQSIAFCRGLEPLLDPAARRTARLLLPAVDPGLGFDPDGPMCRYAERPFFAERESREGICH